MNEMFFYHEQNRMQFRNYSSCWAYGQLPTWRTTGLLWWISLRQCSNWRVLAKLILEERNYSSVGAIF